MRPLPTRVVGVDFSGAKLAGRAAWVAACDVIGPKLKLVRLAALGTLAGTDEREPALAWLVAHVRAAPAGTLFAIDFPFGLPVELEGSWRAQLAEVALWQGGAHAWGVALLNRAKLLGGANHLRRPTDVAQKTPFDAYHYRIIHQTFHGMRDVLAPLVGDGRVALWPFETRAAEVTVVEACPSSTLKRLRLPSRNYKQPAAKYGAVDPSKVANRRLIRAGLASTVDLTPGQVRVLYADPGGDALDAVIAAAGAWQSWPTTPDPPVGDRAREEGVIVA